MGKVKKIALFTATRADWGYVRPVMEALRRDGRLKPALFVTGTHLEARFGRTVREIRRAGFRPCAEIKMFRRTRGPGALARALGHLGVGMADALLKEKPDVLLVLGDRGEVLTAAMAALHLGMAVAHMHGGDISTGGNFDDTIRNAVSKLAHIHFPATARSGRRLLAMGEDPGRIHVVGSTSLDVLRSIELPGRNELAFKLGMELASPLALVLQHPETIRPARAGIQFRAMLGAVRSKARSIVIVAPNADPGSERIFTVLGKTRQNTRLKVFANLSQETYLGLLAEADVMVGNSSSALIEGPYFGLPAVNLGDRQEGRDRRANVIDAPFERAAIERAIDKALGDKAYLRRVKRLSRSLARGNASGAIVRVLASLEVNEALLKKF